RVIRAGCCWLSIDRFRRVFIILCDRSAGSYLQLTFEETLGRSVKRSRCRKSQTNTYGHQVSDQLGHGYIKKAGRDRFSPIPPFCKLTLLLRERQLICSTSVRSGK